MSDQKPRELFLMLNNPDSTEPEQCLAYKEQPSEPMRSLAIHLIEKSAYDDLENEMRVELGHAGLELEGYRMWTNQLRAKLDLAIGLIQKHVDNMKLGTYIPISEWKETLTKLQERK